MGEAPRVCGGRSRLFGGIRSHPYKALFCIEQDEARTQKYRVHIHKHPLYCMTPSETQDTERRCNDISLDHGALRFPLDEQRDTRSNHENKPLNKFAL